MGETPLVPHYPLRVGSFKKRIILSQCLHTWRVLSHTYLTLVLGAPDPRDLWPKPNTAVSSCPAERAGRRIPTRLYAWQHLREQNKAFPLISEVPVSWPPLPPKVPASAISAMDYISREGDSWSFCGVDPFVVVRPQSAVSVCVRTCRGCVHTCDWETYPANYAYFLAGNILGTLCSPISRRPNSVCL